MHIVIGGGTGYVGQTLVPLCQKAGHQVTVLSRDVTKVRTLFGSEVHAADAAQPPARFDVAINLAGQSVARRWTTAIKREILQSRTRTTSELRQAAQAAGAQAFISASAIGFYGDRGDTEVDESSPPGSGFLADVCQRWEAAATGGPLRTVIVRVGFVIGPGAAAIGKMALPFKLFAGGALAGGRQFVPWIHVQDVAGIFLWAAETSSVHGILNATNPVPATNKAISKSLARALHRPCWAPVPGFAVKLLFGEMGSIALESQRVLPRRTSQLGFPFQWTDLDAAMRDAVK
ncbi:MAG: TIGR01777 family protein [Planctomycetes bacterium]|nr:TIGR01777 family protein [Planctomycetota bacterium]